MNPAVPFVTETTSPIGGRWVNCTEAAMTMAANWSDPGIPGTVAQMRKLRAVGAHTANGGRTQAQIIAAMLALWGHRPEGIHSYSDALAHLRDDCVLTVAGNYHNLPSALQRWDKPFGANPAAWHEVTVGPINPSDVGSDPLVWWRDPLGKGSYRGEWVRWPIVTAFALGPGDILAFPHGGWSMVPFAVTGPGGGTGTIDGKPDTMLIDLATGDMVKPTATVYPLGPAGTLGGLHPGPAHVVADGQLRALLDRNMTVTPVAPVAVAGLAHWTLKDGVLSVTSA